METQAAGAFEQEWGETHPDALEVLVAAARDAGFYVEVDSHGPEAIETLVCLGGRSVRTVYGNAHPGYDLS